MPNAFLPAGGWGGNGFIDRFLSFIVALSKKYVYYLWYYPVCRERSTHRHRWAPTFEKYVDNIPHPTLDTLIIYQRKCNQTKGIRFRHWMRHDVVI
jgi:hypothetical protein